MRARRLLAALAASAALFSVADAAWADDIYNTLDGTIDSTVEVMPLTIGGADGVTTLAVDPTNDDRKNGCNLTGQTTLTIDLRSSNPAVATVSPSSVSFDSCGATRNVTVHALSAGTTQVTATVPLGGNTTGASFNLAPATFDVTVVNTANTAPRVVVTGVTTATSYELGSVPAAGCTATDTEDGVKNFAATLSALTGPDAIRGLGTQIATCTYTDAGGLITTASATYTIADPSAPSVGYTLTPAVPDGDNGWYRSNVGLNWQLSELESTSTLTTNGCGPVSITADQIGTTYTCNATSGGGAATKTTVPIRRDATAPSVAVGTLPTPTGLNGWYTGLVTVPFTATDAMSGVDTATLTATSASEGASVVVSSPVFTDRAGNGSVIGAALTTVKIDSKAPNAPEVSLSPPANADGWNNTDVVVHFEKNGDIGASGVDTCTTDVAVTAETAGKPISGTCTDVAGNVSAATTVTVKLDQTGPSVSGVITQGTQGSNGWYTSDVTATFTGTDTLSGTAGPDKKFVTVTTEGVDVPIVSPAFTDVAGNTTPKGTSNLKASIDKSAPNAPKVSLSATPNAAGWFKDDVTVTFSADGDNGPSGVASCTDKKVVSADTGSAGEVVTGTCTDAAGNVSVESSVTVKLDKSAPVVTGAIVSGQLGEDGWHVSPVTVRFTATDDLSGIVGPDNHQDVLVTTDGLHDVAPPAFYDVAGNLGQGSSVPVKLDTTDPVVKLVGGPVNGASYFPTTVPAAPSCDATDATSGLDLCVVEGYDTTPGTHTVKATGTDNAGNVSVASSTYTVYTLTTQGFFAPVDMSPTAGGIVWNTVKNGSTVPLKFQVFDRGLARTDVAVVKGFTTVSVTCSTPSSTEAPVEFTTTGGTQLRFDGAAGQFIQNWKTPPTAGKCLATTVTLVDGSTITAWFKLK